MATLQQDPRIRLNIKDGRLFLKSTAERFDVILLNLPEPQTAQINRFYTVEFFRELPPSLNSGGILSFQLVASEDYISPTLASFLQCINRSLREVFPEVSTIPGEKVHFFASQTSRHTDRPLRRNSCDGCGRVTCRPVMYASTNLPFRMSADRVAQLAEQIRPRPKTPLTTTLLPSLITLT